MSSNREELKNIAKSGAFGNSRRSFESLSTNERERAITEMNTIGSKAEMHRFEAKQRDAQSGMYKFP